MRLLLKSLLWITGLGLVAALVLGLALALDRRPLVAEPSPPSPAEQTWAADWLAKQRRHHGRAASSNRLELTEPQANLLLNALLGRSGQGQAQVRLGAGRASLALSLKLPLDQLDGYLNLELELVEDDPLPRVESARIAGLPIPGSLAQALAEQALQALDRSQMVHEVRFTPERLTLDYTWRPDMIERFSGGMIASDELPRVLAAQDAIIRYAAAQPGRKPLPLSDLLTHLLQETANDMDPIAGHRALILALAAYVNGQSIRAPDDDSTEPRARPRLVLLRGRVDLSQHFMTSAALAVQGTDTLSSLVGWYKEMSDANGGSGFSFADMMANRAGIRFARLATEKAASARWLQSVARAGLREDDFMPRIDRLPEGLSQARFEDRLGTDKRREYQRLIEQIDRHIESRGLYRQSPG
ncbi:hypothetical protein HW932_05100 [Allochromatium humboldtianum]|uniref:Uncharacterized protein n=1 Tax=Allochromatium humboldtianum TaxID=504901 RepID=A0A850R766_9GAMM|nr:hypothetical protein [Allochromatium humboldtianum]NVZ08635.1 hypothetical protein [Allochromatium humboldtianum]